MRVQDKEIARLGKWLPDKVLFRENLRNFTYPLLITAIMLIETILSPSLNKSIAWYSFYIGAYLKYFLRAGVVLFVVMLIEKRSLSSLRLRNFKKNHAFFWREIFWTFILCLILLIGVRFAPSQPYYHDLSTGRILFHAVYVLIGVSLVEEMIWRGFIFSRLSLSIGKLLALLFGSTFNALWHLPYYLKLLPELNMPILPSLVSAFFMSIIMCFFLLVTEKIIGRWNIYPAIVLHWLGDFGFYLLKKII